VTEDFERENHTIVDLLRSGIDDVIAVYRFGSTVDGVTHAASDTDVAVLARAPIPPAARFDVQETLAGRLGRDVDLVDLAAASPVMAIQIVARGRFEDLTFSAYARLNEERKGILERIAAEGSVYGR